eukprot:CAMPEP_0185794070 /NCGR_PEP_ID=MMETSP1174-20130828/159818_1 /TAXON_ID=35687 /ORGANISM="Dictyocha speculum, Strain CCMP1381" /LENGTH=72 /DNA_ID=CAMNT_0028489273 /DNA_START=1205 /DNA_END=1423 /DNA_ORIENTATION=+
MRIDVAQKKIMTLEEAKTILTAAMRVTLFPPLFDVGAEPQWAAGRGAMMPWSGGGGGPSSLSAFSFMEFMEL